MSLVSGRNDTSEAPGVVEPLEAKTPTSSPTSRDCKSSGSQPSIRVSTRVRKRFGRESICSTFPRPVSGRQNLAECPSNTLSPSCMSRHRGRADLESAIYIHLCVASEDFILSCFRGYLSRDRKAPLSLLESAMAATDLTFWLAVAAALLFLVYRYLTKNYNYWAKQNVPYIKPHLFLGSFSLCKTPLHELERDFYKKLGRIYGRYDGTTPVLSVAEPELLKKILVKHFNVFPNHRDLQFGDPMMDNTLFILEGESWKRVRTIVSPFFTSSRFRKMMPFMQECSDVLIENLKNSMQKNESVHCQRLFGAFTMDVIARCAFGVKINSLHQKDDPVVAKAGLLLKCLLAWRTFMTILFPKLMKLFRISLLNPEIIQFYKDIVVQLVEKRIEDKEQRADFLQLVMDALWENTDDNNNNLKSQIPVPSAVTDINKVDPDAARFPSKGLSHDEFLAQCITFFTAGYDSTTSLLCYAIHNLTTHQDCQQRLLEEINNTLAKHNNSLTYEALSEMKYLDAVISETLRLCPPVVRADRRAETDYILGETDIVIKKGMLVSIPVYAIHRDPQWYPQPDSFKPERFLSPDTSPPSYTHLPFGAGPRVCLGMRFVMVEVKTCLVKVLRQFHIQTCSTTQIPLKYAESRGILTAGRVDVRFQSR